MRVHNCTLISACRKRSSKGWAFLHIYGKIYVVMKDDRKTQRKARTSRNIQHRGICAGKSFVAENRQCRGFYTYIRYRRRFVLFGQRQTEHRPCGSVQNGADTASVRDTIIEKNGRRNQNECGISLVLRIFNERTNTALFYNQLQFQTQIYRTDHRGNILLDIR